MPIARAVRHAGIVVEDLDRALRFYRDLLGLRVVRTMEESGAYLDRMLGLTDARVTTVKLAADDGPMQVELLRFTSHVDGDVSKPPLYAVGPSHVAFTVGDLDRAYKELSEAGVPFNAPPQLSPDGYAKVTYCYDPDGTAVELVEVLR
jgi:catechol 2,3-dioxygenase-like lactoylglutathione lyase family enzyme